MTKIANPHTWEKFTERGDVRRHPGSTFVAHVPEGSEFQQVEIRIQDDIKSRGWETDYGFTVPSSFHMTLLNGLKHRALLGQKEAWPAWLNETVDFPDSVFRMRQRLVEANIEGPKSLAVRAVEMYPLDEHLTIKLRPADESVRQEIERFRSEVGEVLDIPVTSLDHYQLHSTLGYRLTKAEGSLEKLSEAEELYNSWLQEMGDINLEPAFFSLFNDMQSFPPLLYFNPSER
ncbi:TPA: DUF1868 domain-containing protein [Corynebacterium aurimucosum]|nr:DUF1868 domain-containing protein [Corynebacterium aurimucosum]